MFKKRSLALLLVSSLMLFLLSSCGSTSTDDSAATEAPAQSQVAAQAETDPEPVETEEPVEEGPVAYPVTDELYTLDAFIEFPVTLNDYMPNGMEDNTCVSYVQELTNVEIAFQSFASSVAGEQFNLLMASDTLPQLIYEGDQWYATGLDAAVEDGVYLNLTDYVNSDDMYYYYKTLTDWGYLDTKYTMNGNIVCIGGFDETPRSMSNVGIIIRQDYLDAVGMDVPVTYDDYYNVLTAFKTELGLEGSLYIPYMGIDSVDSLCGGYGVALSNFSNFGYYPFYVEDGEIHCGILEDGFVDYMTTMNKWYSEGLIYADFPTMNTYIFGPPNDVVASGDAGIWIGSKFIVNNYASMVTDENFAIVAGYFPRENADSEFDFLGYSAEGATTGGIALNANISDEDLEVALKWLDFWYSGEVPYNIFNYGIEGEGYYIGDDGTPVISDLVIQDGDYSYSQAYNKYTAYLFGTGIYHAENLDLTYSELQLACGETWDYNGNCSARYPSDIMNYFTPDESSEFGNLWGDISTLISENYAAFINGTKSLSEIETFRQTLKDLNIDRCIEIWNDAYSRI